MNPTPPQHTRFRTTIECSGPELHSVVEALAAEGREAFRLEWLGARYRVHVRPRARGKVVRPPQTPPRMSTTENLRRAGVRIPPMPPSENLRAALAILAQRNGIVATEAPRHPRHVGDPPF